MAPDELGVKDVSKKLERSATDLRKAASDLDVLDAAIGDGDHGTSVANLFEKAVAETNLEDPSAGHLLKDFGESVMRHCSGASGSIYALLFTSLGTTLSLNDTIELSDLALGFRRGLDMVKHVGGASRGDATLVDALEPYVEALEEHSRVNMNMSRALDLAADAARRGASSTSSMVAKFGRARGFGERALGHQDPGSRSFAVVANAWRNTYGDDES